MYNIALFINHPTACAIAFISIACATLHLSYLNVITPSLFTQHAQSSLSMANIVETAVGAGSFKTLVGKFFHH
jgi:uncharacterized membrane protein YedE/YeeE